MIHAVFDDLGIISSIVLSYELHDTIFQPLPAACLKVNAAEPCLLFYQWLELCAFEIRSVARKPVFASGAMRMVCLTNGPVRSRTRGYIPLALNRFTSSFRTRPFHATKLRWNSFHESSLTSFADRICPERRRMLRLKALERLPRSERSGTAASIGSEAERISDDLAARCLNYIHHLLKPAHSTSVAPRLQDHEAAKAGT
jgi:hypothetical protein